MNDPTGILLVGHGTRSDAGAAEFLALAQLLTQRFPMLPLAPAYLELRPPTIADAIRQLAAQGVRRILVTPLLLFAAGHAQRDIPSAVQQALIASPEIRAVQTPALELSLLDLSQLHYENSRPSASSSKTLLILVGRGSRDVAATEKMQEFANLLAERTNPSAVRVGFLAMAEPRIRDVLSQAAQEEWDTIVVQPHLLFQGELLEELKRLVIEIANRHPQTQWRLAAHLASNIGSGSPAEQLLVTAVSQLIEVAIPPPIEIPASM